MFIKGVDIMEYIALRENEILLKKNYNIFNTMLELAYVEEDVDEYYSESVKDITDKIKALIKRFIKAFSIYLDNMIKIFSLYKQKKNVDKSIDVIERVLKKNPEIASMKIKWRQFSNAKDDIDFDAKVSKNIAFRIEHLDEEWLTDLMNAYYKNIDGTADTMHDTTIKDALKNNKLASDVIEREINDTMYCMRTLGDRLDKCESLTHKHSQMVKKFIKSIQGYIQSKFQLVTLNIEYFFQEVRLAVLGSVEQEAEKVVVKHNSKFETIEKHATKVDTVNILGYEIELYETDRIIESEFTTGGKPHRVFFDKSFKNKSKAYQKAILYHEYGHIINGHLYNNHYRDEYKLAKIMKKRVKKYLKYVVVEGKEKLKDDDLLIYLLIELEADEFSSRYVGKTLMKKTLEHDYAELLKRVPNLSKQQKQDTLTIGYIRTHML